MLTVCSTLTIIAPLAVAAPPSAADNEQVTQLLDQLGLRALIEQTPTVLATAIEAEAQFLHMTPQASANLRRELEARLKPPQLMQTVTRYLHDHYRADMFGQAQQRLQEPIAKRVRYFDFAMTQAGAEKNLRESLVQHGVANATDVGESEARRALLREIDTATASSLLTATLQSAIAARVHQAAENTAAGVDAKALAAEVAERQRYLAPLAVDYLFYDYRYLRDDELREYRDLMRDPAVQWLLDVGRESVLDAIAGGLTPSPLMQPLNPPR